MHLNTSFPSAFDCYRPRSQKVFGVILVSENNNVLLVKGRKTLKWSFPKGHIKPTETWVQCAFRECFEETGISLEHLKPTNPRKLFSGYYYIYKDVLEISPIINDSSEVIDVAWVPIDKIQYLRCNIDLNNFCDSYNKILMNIL
jgi:8-oxo-dGTP pyrophosphatase MutT (NUDIX family)